MLLWCPRRRTSVEVVILQARLTFPTLCGFQGQLLATLEAVVDGILLVDSRAFTAASLVVGVSSTLGLLSILGGHCVGATGLFLVHLHRFIQIWIVLHLLVGELFSSGAIILVRPVELLTLRVVPLEALVARDPHLTVHFRVLVPAEIDLEAIVALLVLLEAVVAVAA